MRENNGTRFATDGERRNVAVASAVALVVDAATWVFTRDPNVTGVVTFVTAAVCVGYAAVIDIKHRNGRRRSR
ncbi:hypothetical protein [Spirillospora sp. CA-128828]|uniref:hypothetical protein n=1 Tax=Spirillospora sp. CA-128828 TaxID=3240033 RepID=UPI003D92CF7C